MRRVISAIGGVLAVGMVASTVVAEAQTSRWTVRDQGVRKEAFVVSGSRKVALVLSCRQGQRMWMDLHNIGPNGWKAGLPVAIAVDGQEIPMEISGHEAGVTLSNRPDGGLGIDARLIGTIKGGTVLVLAGPAAAAMPGPAKSFAVAGAREALGALEKACGLPVSSVVTRTAPVPPPSSAGAPRPAATGAADQSDHILTATEVRRLVIGRSLVQTQDDGTAWRITFDTDGGFGSTNGRRSTFGSYEIGADGRVCMSGRGPDYCMRYYRKAGVLRVRDLTSGAEIGRVTEEE